MRIVLTLLLAFVAGCNSTGSQSAGGSVGGASSSVAAAAGDRIAVGQAWQQATDVARRGGYKLHDAADLAMTPTPDGFYLDLPGQRGLIVLRDPASQTVKSVQ